MDDLKREYPTVFDGRIRTMEVHISLTEDAKPFSVNSPRSIPFAYHDKLKAELYLLDTKVLLHQATEWCTPIVVAPKKNSDTLFMQRDGHGVIITNSPVEPTTCDQDQDRIKQSKD